MSVTFVMLLFISTQKTMTMKIVEYTYYNYTQNF